MVNQIGNELQAAVEALDAHDPMLAKLKLMRAVTARDVLSRWLELANSGAYAGDESFINIAMGAVDKVFANAALKCTA